MIPLIAKHVDHFDDSPALQFFQTGAYVRASHFQRVRDALCMERLGRKIKERMNLSDRAVDAPSSAHLAPVQDKFLLDWSQVLHFS